MTLGNGASGVAWPAWLHSTVAPRWRMGAGMVVASSNNRQRTEVHVGGGAGHIDDRALAVGDDDADVADRHHRADAGLDQDAAGGAGRVADHDAVLQRRL